MSNLLKSYDLKRVFLDCDDAAARHRRLFFIEQPGTAQGPYFLPVSRGEFYDDVLSVVAGLVLGAAPRLPSDRSPVALVGANSYAWILAFWSVLVTGHELLLLDPELSADEIAALLRFSGAKYVIASQRVLSRCALPLENTSIALDAGTAARSIGDLAGKSARNATDTAAARALIQAAPFDIHRRIVTIPTSGTSGNRKCAGLSSSNIMAPFPTLRERLRLTESDVSLAILPFSHLFGLDVLLMCVGTGAALTLLREISPGSLLTALTATGVSVVSGTPLLWKVLHDRIQHTVAKQSAIAHRVLGSYLECADDTLAARLHLPGRLIAAKIKRRLGPRLRLLLNGGARAIEPHQRFFRRLGLQTLDTYGLTETGAAFTCSSPEETRPNSVGKVIEGVELKVLDCGDDGVGEFCVRGRGVFAGYLHDGDAEASRKLFDDEGFLLTGDLGYIDADGFVFYAGRRGDRVVTASGMNVYPEELEQLFVSSELVHEIAVLGVSGPNGEEIHAVVVPNFAHAQLAGDASSVRVAILHEVARVTSGLPAYKRIGSITISDDELPKSSSRKIRKHILRKRLQSSALAGQAVEGRSNQPRVPDPSASDLMEWMRQRLSTATGRPVAEIDIDRPLAEQDLNSLLAVELIQDANAKLGSAHPPTVFWDYPTIRTLANHLSGAASESNTAAIIASPATSSRRDTGVAVIGIGCRFPGEIQDPSTFWRVLQGGVDATVQIPSDRWDVSRFYDPRPGHPGSTYVTRGGFIADVDRFDAAFFGIRPIEAESMDPQQRLLLQVTWEALEHAGLDPKSLAGSSTGTFVGISSADYAHRLLLGRSPSQMDPYTGTANHFSVASGRLSYSFGFHGPCVANDSSCSSSLAAVHLGVQSLRAGECDLAVAGGVNLILSPFTTLYFSQLRALAADGRCKTFDAAADGFARSEGCGVVVLKRLEDALHDGDRILAVVEGTAINHDGRSNGLTAPNGIAQVQVIRRALQDAGCEASDVDYVEAHGTGTPLGDPIEIAAMNAAYCGTDGGDRRLLVGTVKTNFGHTEAASGIAGLIKAILCLQHGQIPAHLHFRNPTPQIAWGSMRLDVPTELTAWPAKAGRRRAGVSAFGFSGTNAHVILAQPPEAARRPPALVRPLHVLKLSAIDRAALTRFAQRLQDGLRADPSGTDLGALCHAANSGRADFSSRLAIVARSHADLDEALSAYLEGRRSRFVFENSASPSGQRPKVAFLFAGQGSQYAGMGRQLYAFQPVFRRAIDRCAELLTPLLDRPLLRVLYPENVDDRALLDQTQYAQPALFAVEYALCEVWASFGVKPDLVMGHSLGEIAAACAAGVFDVEQAARVIACRAMLMQREPAGCGMLAVIGERTLVESLLVNHAATVTVAAFNGPQHLVLSGAGSALEQLAGELQAHGCTTRVLPVSHAFHSPQMARIADELGRQIERLDLRPPAIPLISNVTGVPVGNEIGTGPYWREHTLKPVLFERGIESLMDARPDIIVEIGPSSTLIAMGKRCLSQRRAIAWLPCLKSGGDDWSVLLASLATFYTRGGAVDWRGYDAGYEFVPATAPTYPFERTRHWIDAPDWVSRVPGEVGAAAPESVTHELSWVPSARTSRPTTVGADVVLRHAVPDELRTRQLVALLRGRGDTVIEVGSVDELEAVLNTAGGAAIRRVVHMLCASPDSESNERLPALEELPETPAGSLFAVAQVIERAALAAPMNVVVVAEYASHVTGREAAIFPERTAMMGSSAVVPESMSTNWQVVAANSRGITTTYCSAIAWGRFSHMS